MPGTPSRLHLVAVVATLAVAVVILLTLVPYAARTLFTPPLRGFTGVRFEVFYYLALALVPVVLWLIPPFARWLARSTYRSHKAFFGRSGFYVRFPVARPLRLRDTLVMALGPFAIDMLAIAEIEYYFGALPSGADPRAFYVAPGLLLLAGMITALVPGGWLVDALDIRLVSPKRGEVNRAAAVVEGLLGPVGAVALLVSFVTTLHGANYSYEAAAFFLAVYALRLFPPILTAVAVYRIFVQPKVLPGLRAWCDREGIPVTPSLEAALASVRPPSDKPAAVASDPGPPREP